MVFDKNSNPITLGDILVKDLQNIDKELICNLEIYSPTKVVVTTRKIADNNGINSYRRYMIDFNYDEKKYILNYMVKVDNLGNYCKT